MSQLISKAKQIDLLASLSENIEKALKSAIDEVFFDDSVDCIDYSSIDEPLSNYHDNADYFADNIGDVYQDVVHRLQEQGQADAHPEAYWDLAAKHVLKHVHRAIQAQQDVMRGL